MEIAAYELIILYHVLPLFSLRYINNGLELFALLQNDKISTT
jgi:hypothetical protein